MDHDVDFARMTAVFRDLALAAGAAIMAVYAREFRVETKADASPVTEADRAADALIAEGLRAAFPALPVVTEEQAETHGLRSERFLIVDPLDGTKDFVARRGDFTVNIAYVDRGRPLRGVIYAPARRRLFYTLANGQAVEEDGPFGPAPGPTHPLRVRRPDNGALVVVASKSHRSPALEDYIARYEVAAATAAGSSLKFCLVAGGEADLYPRLGPTMEWDTAAGDAILRGAGGAVARLDTLEPLLYGKPGFLNPDFVAHAPGVALLPA